MLLSVDTCTKCGEEKPLTEFGVRSDRGVGRFRQCKTCINARNRELGSESTKKRVLAGTSEWERRQEYFRAYQESGRRSKVVNARYRKLKDAVIEGYGGCCKKCGFSDRRAIHIDHVNGNGGEERKKTGAAPMLRKIIKAGFPDTYQLLCANCNMIKMYENQEFPGWQSMAKVY
jgi:hypothetical protein